MFDYQPLGMWEKLQAWRNYEALTKEASTEVRADGSTAGSDHEPAEEELRLYQKRQERKRSVGFVRQRKSPLLFRDDSKAIKQAQQQEIKESSMLVKRAQRQEIQSLVMLKAAAAKVMLRRGVNPSLIDAMLKSGAGAFPLPYIQSPAVSRILSELRLHAILKAIPKQLGESQRKTQKALLATGLVGTGVFGGAAAYNHLQSPGAAEGDTPAAKGDTPAAKGDTPVAEGDTKAPPKADPKAQPMSNPAGIALRGAAVGGGLGGLYGLIAPGEDEKGKSRSRLEAMLTRGLIGAGIGGGIGGAGSIAANLTKAASRVVKRAQRQEIQSLVMLKVAAAKVMLRRGVSPSLIEAMLKSGGEPTTYMTTAMPRVPEPITNHPIEGLARMLATPARNTVAGLDAMSSPFRQGLIGAGPRAVPMPTELPTVKESSLRVKRALLDGLVSGSAIGGGLGGAALGGGLGGLYGLLDPGEDEQGKPRSRLDAALTRGLVGAGLGGAAGGLGGIAYDAMSGPSADEQAAMLQKQVAAALNQNKLEKWHKAHPQYMPEKAKSSLRTWEPPPGTKPGDQPGSVPMANKPQLKLDKDTDYFGGGGDYGPSGAASSSGDARAAEELRWNKLSIAEQAKEIAALRARVGQSRK